MELGPGHLMCVAYMGDSVYCRFRMSCCRIRYGHHCLLKRINWQKHSPAMLVCDDDVTLLTSLASPRSAVLDDVLEPLGDPGKKGLLLKALFAFDC